ncbi:LLM class flavin-dependent oxidoreductase [Paenibacillus mucilaginosus]|uniref:LLM class flavin-dependent oxidoreductase n=1 Tax=Paenibacillus mucilaginosus TaxID=61624 RepID=UPI00240D57A6|nr:LLM class flavin-dependent oxidoreductase [Paenibacillus mucilaginosus]WFA19997.1 LLM class flavin-dependent oxidoreductase [Paenibacillus mucilaginosus]
MNLHLSVLDQSPIPEGSTAGETLAETARLAKEAERLGFRRFWVSEHHAAGSLAGSSPEVLISHLAAVTSRIRLGSGGVMLPHYSAYKVAENFRLLEALYPGRIDVGLGRAGGMPLATRALQEGRADIDRYPSRWRTSPPTCGTRWPGHRFAGLKASPVIPSVPPLWLLGSSDESARIAAEQGTAFAYAHFINGYGGPEAVRRYRDHFRPASEGDRPQSLVAVFTVCAETDEEAERLASSMDLSFLFHEKGVQRPGIPSPETAANYPYTAYDRMRIESNRSRMIVGSVTTVKAKLIEMSERYGTDELMIVTIMHDFEARLRSYRLLAEAFGLPQAPS